jgi:hypothetical protein
MGGLIYAIISIGSHKAHLKSVQTGGDKNWQQLTS